MTSDVSKFLDGNEAALGAHVDKIRTCEDALKSVGQVGETDNVEFHKQIVPILEDFRDSAAELHLLKSPRRILEASMQEDGKDAVMNIGGGLYDALLESMEQAENGEKRGPWGIGDENEKEESDDED
ncbi:hypothetical protein BDW68DRAFT_176077 [Aspergillus falconensis]